VILEPDVLDLSVGEFSRRLARLIAGAKSLQRIAIRGEVSKWNPQPNGNLYFTLKDAESALSCFAFGSDVRRFPEVADGVAVRAIGEIGIRDQRSEYQLRVVDLEPTGIGALAAQVEELRERLRREGALEESRRRPIPRFPRRIALISAAGEAKEDFERLIRARAPHVQVRFFATRVQGKGAEVEIATALDEASRADVDVIVLTRGGGSYEDRFPFNLEPVVRAILRSRHPVITAIGHDRDHHLADDVADLEATTPTAAAEHVASEWTKSFDRLERARSGLLRGLRDTAIRRAQRLDTAQAALSHARQRFVSVARERLAALERGLDQCSPLRRLAERQARLASLRGRIDAWHGPAMDRWQTVVSTRSERLGRMPKRLVELWRGDLERAEQQLETFNPTRPLERGYAILSKGGRTVRDVRDVAVGDMLAARLLHGTLDARVERAHSDE
jgi:exodeoxyribonuclease VII large subunit